MEGTKTQIDNIILFGSIVRDEFDKESDIDLFFDTPNEKKLEPEIKSMINSFELRKSKFWELKNIDFPIKPMVGSLKDESWSELKEELISYGITLYGKFESTSKYKNHYVLLSYSLENLDQITKMKFIRSLFGYQNKIKNKTYGKKGYLYEIEGIKLGSNNIMVPIKTIYDVRSLFKKFKITPKMYELWIKE